MTNNQSPDMPEEYCPFYEARVDTNGFVWLRIDNQSFRLSHDPDEADKIEGIPGHGKQYSEWLRRQLQTALDKMAFRYNDIRTMKQ